MIFGQLIISEYMKIVEFRFSTDGVVLYSIKTPLKTNEAGIWNGGDAPEGVYYFVIKPTDPELEPITGTIVLQR